MLQFTDISASVYYDQTLAETKLLERINACISHELRNPLQSIVAQNLMKATIYEEMMGVIKSDDPNKEERLMSLLEKLNQGKKVQQSSAELMSSLVNDFLDYS